MLAVRKLWFGIEALADCLGIIIIEDVLHGLVGDEAHDAQIASAAIGSRRFHQLCLWIDGEFSGHAVCPGHSILQIGVAAALPTAALFLLPGQCAQCYRLSFFTTFARGGFDSLGRAEELRSEEHTSELQSLMRISYAVFCLNKKKHIHSIY